MASVTDIRQTFFQECEELLEALNDGLEQIDQAAASGMTTEAETVNAVFRAVHSIKGGAAAFGLKALVAFSHRFENALDDLRSGRITLSAPLTRLCHRAADHLSDLVRAGRDGLDSPEDVSDEIGRLLADICAGNPADVAAAEELPAAVDDPVFEFVPLALPIVPVDGAPDGVRHWQIHFRTAPGFVETGNDPVHLFRELASLGDLASHADLGALPALEDLDPTDIHVSWTLTLDTDAGEAAIREVFDFVTGLCVLEILPDGGAITAVPADLATCTPGMAADDRPQDGMAPFGSAPSLAPGPAPSGTNTSGRPDLFASSAMPTAGNPAETKSAQPATPAAAANRATVRVDLDLVDRLINMVGELVINQAVLTQCVQDAGIGKRSPLMASLSDLRNLTREIQESVMAIRAQPVKPLFQRMARIVREASEMAGKTALFVTEGDTTEVDKTVIEQLVDPLTHMIRNAIDHGLEPVEVRSAAGKTDSGTVKLTAAHRSGRVVIEVADDGAGINRPKVLEIAKRKGLVAPGAELTDQEIDNLLFLPGFSTASTITDLSGRGVGMDVVQSAIRRLGGRVAVSSVPGRGTTMSVSLPLTLAVLDGMVVDVAGQTMVVPITAIVETIRPDEGSIHPLGPTGVVVGVRDSFVPVIDLGVLFGHRNTARPISEMVLLLVETDARATCALAVDKIYDQRQIVIKGLETNYGHVPCVAAATILGDGKIALIIDPEETAAMGRSAGAAPAGRKE